MFSSGECLTPFEADSVRKSSSTSAHANTRIVALDGLRGIACLMVVCSHFFCDTFGQTAALMDTPLIKAVFDGNLAVAVFFIISGDALSSGFLRKRNAASILRPAIKRYPRLVVPTLLSTAFLFLLIRLHLVYEIPTQDILGSKWLFHWINEDITLVDVLRFSFLDVFLKNRAHYFNPFLWTMHYEAIGSIVIFLMLALLHLNRKALPVLLALTLLVFHDGKSVVFLLCFLFGAFLAFLRTSGNMSRFERTAASSVLFLSALPVLFVLSLVFPHAYFHTGLSLIKAPLFTLAFLGNAQGRRFLETRGIQFLGEISFPLFLFQYSVLISVTSFLIVTYYPLHHTVEMACFIATSGVLLSMILATVTSPMENLTKSICNIVYENAMRLLKDGAAIRE